MNVIIDRERLRRRAAVSHVASLGGILLILASVGLSMWRPQLTTLTAVMLFAGFATSTIGIFYANRWVKRPRPEEILDRALKGLDNRHRLYHYLPRGPDHLLLTPSGLVVLETRSEEGYFEFKDGRWHQKITLGKALRFFVEESLGDPIADARREITRLARALEDRAPSLGSIPAATIVVFTHPNATLVSKGNPIPIVQPKHLSKALPKNQPALRPEAYAALCTAFDDGGPG